MKTVSKRIKISLLIINLSVLALSIATAFILSFAIPQTNFASNDIGNVIVYIVVKSIVSIGLLGVTITSCLSKRDVGISIINIALSLGFQLLPILPRALGITVAYHNDLSWLWIISFLVSFVLIIVYLVIILFNGALAARLRESKANVQAKEKPVVEKTAKFDENGDFKGPNN